ncbi:unnamed protein product [Camellia sinensis]
MDYCFMHPLHSHGLTLRLCYYFGNVGNVDNVVNLDRGCNCGFENLVGLRVMVKVLKHERSSVAFSALKSLELRDLPAVTHLWKGPTQLVRLRNLTSLILTNCDELESLFSLSIARDLMPLQKLYVSNCRKMEVLISSEEEGDQNEIASTTTETTDKIVFPKLKELYLACLPSFTALCKAMNGIELLQLNKLKLWGIPKLNSFCNTSDSSYHTIQPLFNE